MAAGGKTQKVSVTLPRDLVGEIRSIVPQGQVSSFFTEALEHYLAFRKQKLALDKGFGAWKDKNHPALSTSQDSTTYVQSIRETDKKRQERLRGRVAK